MIASLFVNYSNLFMFCEYLNQNDSGSLCGCLDMWWVVICDVKLCVEFLHYETLMVKQGKKALDRCAKDNT